MTSEPVVSSSTTETVFRELVGQRHSCRQFLPRPVSDEVMRGLWADAITAPSNCNTQPWEVHVVSGAARNRLSAALIAADERGENTRDFFFDATAYTGDLGERRRAQGAAYYQALGVERADVEGRRTASVANLDFFGAPHAAFLFMPEIGDSVRVASDVGMFAQTFLLALTARGLAGTPQTALSRQADTVRRELGIGPEAKLLFGISFGYPDTDAPGNGYRIGRAPVESLVTIHDR